MRDIEKNNNLKNETKAQSILEANGYKFKPKINSLSRKIVRLNRSKSKSDQEDINEYFHDPNKPNSEKNLTIYEKAQGKKGRYQNNYSATGKRKDSKSKISKA